MLKNLGVTLQCVVTKISSEGELAHEELQMTPNQVEGRHTSQEGPTQHPRGCNNSYINKNNQKYGPTSNVRESNKS